LYSKLLLIDAGVIDDLGIKRSLCGLLMPKKSVISLDKFVIIYRSCIGYKAT